ncbi:MAG: HAD family phosphatase [Firmicutes bacterium]|nr:HAD family phosphatase [Bacillota bacterium]
MDIELIALDLDGTLLDPGTRIQPETISVLDQFVASGGLVVIDTGRPLPAIYRILTDNGVLPGKPYPHALIAEEREIYLRGSDGQFEPLQPWNDEIIAAEKALLPTARAIAAKVEAELKDEGITGRVPDVAMENERGFVERHFHRREHAERARELAEAYLSDGIPLRVVRNNRLIAFRHRDIGKGILLARLAELLDVPQSKVFAVGDSHNDLCMLDGRFGFQSGTVANADPEIQEVIRQKGGPIASQPTSLGVAELVRGLMEGNSAR